MKNIIKFMVAAIIAAAPLFASLPAHAQWVAQAPVPTSPQPTTTRTAIGNPSLQGEIVGFDATSATSGQYDTADNINCVGNLSYGWQWTQTYSWTGSGSAPNFVVKITTVANAAATATYPAYASGGGDAEYAPGNGSNVVLGSTTGYGYQTTNNKTNGGVNVSIPAATPTLKVTVSASGSGQTLSNGGAFSDSGEGSVSVGNPQ